MEVICGDRQSKPDIGANLARQWIDFDKVDVIADINNSSVALAVNIVPAKRTRSNSTLAPPAPILPTRSARRTRCTRLMIPAYWRIQPASRW